MPDKHDSGQTSQSGLPIGSKIGKYEIRAKIGVGGQAIVYKCYDELLDRYVAVKQINARLAEDPSFVERFRKEAQTLARLGAEQPEIITVYELLASEQGLFIVMELAEGDSLETVMANFTAPSDPRATLQVLWRLAAGLNAVHSAGIVHRDLKPSNVIVAQGLKVKITDFGIASAAGGQTSVLMGTTKYMAPEVFEGEKTDAKADIYSLGFIMYELLAGRDKFDDVFADVVKDKHSEALRWMKWHGNRDVAAPTLAELNIGVPKPLSDIVAKMMAKDPGDRFDSMEHLGRTIKANFSTRGRDDDGLAGRSAPPAGGAFAGDLGPKDEADNLRVAPAEPITAPIPPRKMPPAARWTVISLCVAAVLAVGLVLGGVVTRDRRDRVRQARGAYEEAVGDYKVGSFAAAGEKFRKVAATYGKTQWGVRAGLMAEFARGYDAVERHDWTAASGADQSILDEIQSVEQHDQDLKDWARARRTDLDDFRSYRLRNWDFHDAMDAASQAARLGRFAEARDKLKTRLMNFSPTPQQDARLNAFMAELDAKELEARVDSSLGEASELIDKGEFDQAAAVYDDLDKRLDEDDQLEKLGADKAKELTDRLAKARVGLAADKEYAEAVARARAAHTSGDAAGELAAMKDAAAARPGRVDSARLKELEIAVALADAGKLFDEGRLAQAADAYRGVLKIDAANAKALAGLERTRNAVGRLALVEGARSDMKDARYADALAKLEQAQAIEADPQVAAMIVECEFKKGLADAEKLSSEHKYDEAIDVYESLRAVKPAEAANIDAWQAEARLRKAYDAEITLGDQALAGREWAEAIRHYRQAGSLIPGEQADRMVSDAQYAQNLFKGRQAMAQGDLSGAKGYFSLAKRYKDTREITDLLTDVEKQLEQ